jgi:hypothetical protein
MNIGDLPNHVKHYVCMLSLQQAIIMNITSPSTKYTCSILYHENNFKYHEKNLYIKKFF